MTDWHAPGTGVAPYLENFRESPPRTGLPALPYATATEKICAASTGRPGAPKPAA